MVLEVGGREDEKEWKDTDKEKKIMQNFVIMIQKYLRGS